MCPRREFAPGEPAQTRFEEEGKPMLVVGYLARHWWAFVLQGVIAILFGALAFLRPGITLESLVLLFRNLGAGKRHPGPDLLGRGGPSARALVAVGIGGTAGDFRRVAHAVSPSWRWS